RETSGLLVFAKSPAAKAHLQAQFEARTVLRVYRALVKGQVRQESGTLESRLVEDRSLRVRATSGREGKTAVTRYRVLGRGADTTLLELSLGTGRRRQIRVQLAGMGHPIVGDREHGGPAGPFRRLCLHATCLGFSHPDTGQAMRFESAAPAAWVQSARSKHPSPLRGEGRVRGGYSRRHHGRVAVFPREVGRDRH